MHFVVSGLLILLLGSYVDNVRGPLLPVLSEVLQLSYSQASILLVMGSIAAMATFWVMIWLNRRFCVRDVAIMGCGVVALASLIAPLVSRFEWLLILAPLLGVAVAMVGGVCNLLIFKGTDLNNRGRALCALHMMYGIGSFAAPPVFALILSAGLPWYWAVSLSIIPAFLLAAYMKQYLPKETPEYVVARTSGTRNPRQATGVDTARLTITRVHLLIISSFAIYVGGEVLTSMWMSTYLVEYLHLNVAQASPYLSAFFVMMGLSRLACYLLLKPQHEVYALAGCLVVSIFFFTLGHLGWLHGFWLAGLLGPFFPLFLARVSRQFPEEAGALTLLILSSVHLVLTLSHFFLGRLTDQIGIGNAYYLPIGFLSVSLAILLAYLKTAPLRSQTTA